MAAKLRQLLEEIGSDRFYWEKRRSGTCAFRSAASPADQREFKEGQKQGRLMTQVFSKTL